MTVAGLESISQHLMLCYICTLSNTEENMCLQTKQTEYCWHRLNLFHNRKILGRCNAM